MKYLKLVILFFIFTSALNAKSKSDVIFIQLVLGGGNHTIATFIGSDINDVYSTIYRHGNSNGDEFGMPIYILSPKLVKYIEWYVQSQGFFNPLRIGNDSLFYYVGFKTQGLLGLEQYFKYSIGGLSDSKNYFLKMLWWIDTYASKKDSPEFEEFISYLRQDFVDFNGMLYSPLQFKRFMDRKAYEEKLQNCRWLYYPN